MDGLARVKAEVKRVVIPIDDRFSSRHPRRKYWIRPSQPIEVAELEIMLDRALPELNGHRWYSVVRKLRGRARQRVLVSIKDLDETRLTEKFCRQWYEELMPGVRV